MPRRFVLGTLLLSACTLQHTPRPGPRPDDHIAHMSAADVAAPAADGATREALRQGTPGLPASNLAAAAGLGLRTARARRTLP